MVHGPSSPSEGKRGAVHLVVLAEIIQETLVDGIQVNDEEVVHWSIIARHGGPSPAGAVEGNCQAFRAASRPPPRSSTLRLPRRLIGGAERL